MFIILCSYIHQSYSSSAVVVYAWRIGETTGLKKKVSQSEKKRKKGKREKGKGEKTTNENKYLKSRRRIRKKKDRIAARA